MGCPGVMIVLNWDGGGSEFQPLDPRIQPFDKSVAGSSLDGDFLPLPSGELYVASLMMEDVVLCEGQINEITVGSIYDDDHPVDKQALHFGEAQKADPDIVVVSGWCSSQMFPKSKAEMMIPVYCGGREPVC